MPISQTFFWLEVGCVTIFSVKMMEMEERLLNPVFVGFLLD